MCVLNSAVCEYITRPTDPFLKTASKHASTIECKNFFAMGNNRNSCSYFSILPLVSWIFSFWHVKKWEYIRQFMSRLRCKSIRPVRREEDMAK